LIDTQGIMLASGGPSVMLVGRDVSTVLPLELMAGFRRALA
jgi:cytochrome c